MKHEDVVAELKQVARIAITPYWAKLLDFETRLPIALEQLLGNKADPPQQARISVTFASTS